MGMSMSSTSSRNRTLFGARIFDVITSHHQQIQITIAVHLSPNIRTKEDDFCEGTGQRLVSQRTTASTFSGVIAQADINQPIHKLRERCASRLLASEISRSPPQRRRVAHIALIEIHIFPRSNLPRKLPRLICRGSTRCADRIPFAQRFCKARRRKSSSAGLFSAHTKVLRGRAGCRLRQFFPLQYARTNILACPKFGPNSGRRQTSSSAPANCSPRTSAAAIRISKSFRAI